jgi:formylmethanofuran dehydrogenase subunit B
MAKRVLAIGIEPGGADHRAFPQFTPELVRNYIDAQLLRLTDLGYDVTSCLIDLDETPGVAVTSTLREASFDCVVIGAGLREPKERLQLFESVINLVHRLAPNAAICFNTNPADTAEAVQRWIAP